MDLNELDEGPLSDFQGATLQIHSDSFLISPSSDSEPLTRQTAPLSTLSNSPNNLPLLSANNLRPASDNRNTEEIVLTPAVLSGTDSVSPIASIQSKLTDTFRRSRTRGITDVVLQNPLLAEDEAKDYFTFRDGIVESAIKECIKDLIIPEQDGEVIGSWLLTEISFWDNEKERLIVLTTRIVTTIKYDFIALKQLEYRKVPIALVDTLVIGDLVYPTGSFVPRLNGLASGVTTVFKGFLLRPLQERWSRSDSKAYCATPFDYGSFEPRSRNVRGVRAMWNRGEPLTFGKKWNPFNNEIPWATYSSHPLLYHKESTTAEGNKMYDLEDFAASFVTAIERAQAGTVTDGSDVKCMIKHNPIVLQNYVGLSSLIHNRNGLGFFKVRGKFSF